MKNSKLYLSAAIVAAALLMTLAYSRAALAGGFQLSVETPASHDGQLKDAVLLVKTYGCFQATDAGVVATAEGLVNGERKSVTLELKPVSTGTYAVSRQWPSEGAWVLTFSGKYNGMSCSVLVDLGPGGKVKPGTRLEAGSPKGMNARSVRRALTAKEIDQALKGTTGDIGGAEADSASRSGWGITGLASIVSVGALGVVIGRRLINRDQDPLGSR